LSAIELRGVTKRYGENPPVIEDMDLTIADGGFTVLLGPSGCGKSTILRIIAGLEPHDGGSVRIGGRDMDGMAPGERGVAMVFQNYALYPAMTVRENMEFGLKNMKVPKAEREARIAECARIVDLEPFLDRKPKSLSGGQRQRVALARAIVKKSGVFLMDEPLSNLDAKLRAQIRADLIELHRKLGITFLYVTHDQVEAMSMGTEIVLLEGGAVRQKAAPTELYDAPANLFAARFIGSPPMNIIETDSKLRRDTGVDAPYIGFRPERAWIMRGDGTPPPGAVSFRGVLAARELLGDRTVYKIKTDAGDIYATESSASARSGGAGETEPGGAALRSGRPVEVTVAAGRGDLHFFDGAENAIPPAQVSVEVISVPAGICS
jgi:sn-glycerol 3-phosphate transport system ATP-binding protein